MNNLQDVYNTVQRLFPASDAQPTPLKAAVAVLWRASPELEVYLVRRSLTLRFLPGFWSFPGGKQEEEDGSPAHAAVRELREETSVLAAPTTAVPAGRWITPPAALRFDTRFFFVELPSGQKADFSVSGGELINGRWIAPHDALREFEEGRLLINAPIIGLLQALVPGIDSAEIRAQVIAKEYEAQWPRLRPVAGGISVLPLRTPTLPPATTTNCYVVGTGERIIIDPATPDPDERDVLVHALEAMLSDGGSLLAIWLTHHHHDHVGAAEFISERYGIPICAHPETAALLAGHCRVDRHLTDGERQPLSGPLPRELQCVFTPGHAAGHLCFWERHTRALIVGDMVASVGSILIDPSDGNMSDYLASLRRMRAMDTSLLLPAHGSALSEPTHSIDTYIAHRLMRESQVIEALTSEAQSLESLVQIVYADTPVALHGLAQRSLHSHLLKLQSENRAEEGHHLGRAGWLAIANS